MRGAENSGPNRGPAELRSLLEPDQFDIGKDDGAISCVCRRISFGGVSRPSKDMTEAPINDNAVHVSQRLACRPRLHPRYLHPSVLEVEHHIRIRHVRQRQRCVVSRGIQSIRDGFSQVIRFPTTQPDRVFENARAQ